MGPSDVWAGVGLGFGASDSKSARDKEEGSMGRFAVVLRAPEGSQKVARARTISRGCVWIAFVMWVIRKRRCRRWKASFGTTSND